MNRLSASVIAYFTSDRKVLPIKILTEDGFKFKVDRITDVRPAASLKAGVSGMRYICACTLDDENLSFNEVHLYRDDDAWFVELNGFV